MLKHLARWLKIYCFHINLHNSVKLHLFFFNRLILISELEITRLSPLVQPQPVSNNIQQHFISFLKEQGFKHWQPAAGIANRGESLEIKTKINIAPSNMAEIKTKINIAPSNMTEIKTHYLDFVIYTVEVNNMYIQWLWLTLY